MPRSKKNESSIEFDETRILRLLETSLKYKEVPELAGTWIPIESFETLEEDLLSAIQPAIPHIRGLCETDRNWLPESSLVTFLLRYSFKVNLVVDNFDIEPGPGKEILESLCILTEENGHLALEPDWEEQTRLSFERSLRENQNKLFLRLYMNHCDDLTVRWDRGKKNKEQIEEEHCYLHGSKHDSLYLVYRDLSRIAGRHYFPRQMYVFDACYSNAPDFAWMYKHFQFP